MPSFRALAGERVEVVLQRGEAALLAGLPRQILELVESGEGRVHDRLFPPAYLDPTEEDAEAEWQRLMHQDLVRAKVDALEGLAVSLEDASASTDERVVLELDAEETAAWLGALNDLRLALGVMLEVTEDLDVSRIDPADPRAPGLHLYGFLTWIQGDLIEALNP